MSFTIISQNSIPVKTNISNTELLDYYYSLKSHKNVYRVELDIHSVFCSTIGRICIEYSNNTKIYLKIIYNKTRFIDIIRSIILKNS